jgi:hypothetical protein
VNFPSQIGDGGSVTLTPQWSSLTPADTINSYVIDWGDGTTGGSLSHTYPSGWPVGRYGFNIEVAASTSGGLIQANTSVTMVIPGTGPSESVEIWPTTSLTEQQSGEIDLFICNGSDPVPQYLTVDFGDGGSEQVQAFDVQSGPLTYGADYIADHTYSEEGLYLCSASGTGPTGVSFSGAAALPVSSDSMLHVGTVSTAYNSGNSVTLTAPVTGLVVGETATAWAGENGSPQTPATLTDHGDGTGTITATFTDVPMSFTGTTLWVYSEDGDDSASADATVTPYQAGLTIGDAVAPTPPHESAATAFIPVDDGYMTDTQSVPNDQLTDPDPTDPALVYGYASFSTRLDLTGTWQLNFPSSDRAFEVETNGTLDELQSGVASSPQTISNVPDTIPLAFEGVSAVSSAMITAVLTPTSLPASQPATAAVQADVVQDPLTVLSANNNVAGPALTPAQQKKSGTIFLPVSAPIWGFEYKLPLNITVPMRTALQLPTNWAIYNSTTNKPMPKVDGTNEVIFNPQDSGQFYIEANDLGGVAPTNSVTVTLFGAVAGQPRTQLGVAKITPFFLSFGKDPKKNGTIGTAVGANFVPQFGTYEYKVTPLEGGTNVWQNPTTGGSMTIPNPNQPNDVKITWGGGPSLEQAVFEADPQFVWDMPVSVFKIDVAPNVNGIKGQVVGNKNKAGYIQVSTSTTYLGASVTVTGPNGNRGANHLTVGFVQNLSVQQFTATYFDPRHPNAAPPEYHVYQKSTGIALDALDPIGNHYTFWDTQDKADYSSKLYPRMKTITLGNKGWTTQFTPAKSGITNAATIVTSDEPFMAFPPTQVSAQAGKLQFEGDSILWNLTMYVVASTDETANGANQVYAGQASTQWVFNGTGTFANNKWTANGAQVTFTTNAWQAATARNPLQPITAGTRFNDIAEGDYVLK